MNRDQKMFAASLAFFVVTCVVVGLAFFQGRSADSIVIPPGGSTNVPMAAVSPMPAELTAELQQMLDDCADYSPERRSQMQQHITWLQDPSQIPADLRPAFGANPVGKLIFGMATYTSIEWRLQDRQQESCLLPFGRRLNALAVEYGEVEVEGFEQR